MTEISSEQPPDEMESKLLLSNFFPLQRGRDDHSCVCLGKMQLPVTLVVAVVSVCMEGTLATLTYFSTDPVWGKADGNAAHGSSGSL